MNFSVGAAMDPYVEVTDSSVCDGPSCSYVFSYEINASPFDPDSLSLGTTSLVNDSGTNNPIGFSHELSILANRVAPEFRDRPWVVNIGFDYCLARMPAACQGDSFDTNKNGDLELDILMLPE
jgi:hypothetical protein